MHVESSAAMRPAMSFGSGFRACAARLMAILRTPGYGKRAAAPPPDMRLQPRGRLAGDTAEHGRGEQAVARQIARSLGAGDADRRAAGREQIRKRPALWVQHARLRIDREAALGME